MRLVEIRAKDEYYEPVRFLGLQAIYYRLRAKDIKLNQEETRLTLNNPEQKEIPILQMTDFKGRPLFFFSTKDKLKDRRAEIFIRFSPQETLDEKTICYACLLHEPENSSEWQRFQGKVVLIGEMKGDLDKHSIYYGKERFGVHILADGINTILVGQYIQYAQTYAHIAILLTMSFMGAWLRLRISPDRQMIGRGLILALSLLYLAGAIFLYIHFLILLKVAYHLVVLGLTYWSVGLIRKRFAELSGTL